MVGDARGRRRERARRARRAVIDGDDAGLYDAAARRARKGVDDARALGSREGLRSSARVRRGRWRARDGGAGGARERR